MKKFIYTVLFVMLMTIFPMISKATEYKKVNLEEYNTMNLMETLESEKIEPKFTDYKEKDDQVTIYLFRGTGCAYCRAFLTFLSELEAEYYNKIKVVAFDAWYDEDSSILLGEISSFLGEEAGGVPYIIIGEDVFPGYAADYNEAIKASIDKQYKESTKYNVFEEYNKHIDELIKEERQEKMMPVLWNGLITVICTVFIVLYVKYSNSKLLYALCGGELSETNLEATEEIVYEKTTEKQEKNNNTNKKNNKHVNKTNKKMN